jgi:hypothetical protein
VERSETTVVRNLSDPTACCEQPRERQQCNRKDLNEARRAQRSEHVWTWFKSF